MKKIIISLVMLILIFPSVSILAVEEVPGSENIVEDAKESDIIIDGIFDDWMDKPSIIDKSNDSGSEGQDLKEVRFYADDKYLYLYIERYKVSQGWDLWIPILNGQGHEQSVFMPWEHGNLDKKESWEWVSDKVSCFKISVDFSSWNNNSLAVKTKIGDVSLGEDQTYYNTDGTKFEVRLPLDAVGLAGVNKEIKFSVASDISQWSPTNVDWIKDDGPIVVTQGPIFGSMTPVVAIAGFAGISFIATKKKKIIKRNES